jgi:hypothetical protein
LVLNKFKHCFSPQSSKNAFSAIHISNFYAKSSQQTNGQA